MEYGGLKALIR